MMSDIDKNLVLAHVDGELDELTSGRVAKLLARDEQAAALAEAQRRLKDRLADNYGPVAEEEVPERFRALLETNVVPLPARPARELRFAWRAAGAMAASFLVGLLVAQALPERTAPAGLSGEPIMASGALAAALDRQLASEQWPTAPTRIGVTFAAKDGRLCRSFESGQTAGLACRDGERWRIAAAAAVQPGPSGEYRQAASGTAFVMRFSQELMAGEPFDAQAERRAMDTGWASRR